MPFLGLSSGVLLIYLVQLFSIVNSLQWNFLLAQYLTRGFLFAKLLGFK